MLTVQAAEPVPFVLPWNDATPGVTDFSSLNPPIEAGSRVTVDAQGHFAVNGRRVRFLGMNFAGDSPFMPTNKADGVAARLAKFGVNNVRFHHLDATWATGGGLLNYTATSSRNIRAAQLERLHFLVARLKAHGIYANINLLVGREYRSGDGLGTEVTTMDWKDQHILGFFNDTALALHQEYATQVLTPVNPFTGLSLAADPAVAFVEIINENGILQKWYDGGLDRLPSRYAGQLQSLWNDWLAARYEDDAALRAVWHPLNEPLQANLLKNGTFAGGVTSWRLEQHAGAAATFTRTSDFHGGPAGRVTVTKTGSSWHVQVNQANLPVTAGQVYTLTFSAKADAPTGLDVSVMQAHDPWEAIGFSRTVQLGADWQSYTNVFIGAPTGGGTDNNARVNFGGLGTRLGSVWFADVRFQKGGSLGNPPAGATLAQRNLPNVRHSGDGFTGTAGARKDWLRFLRDREVAYYDAMVGHVRARCGYPGLIFGTIMANSPATVQNRLDVIDGHAYWQHPQFPGQPWDAVNWIVPNRSLVNTTNSDNPLLGLSRQRIQGKPFTVTEYQHPSPMHYGAEGPLLLAAQAALQDWDGLWLFDYGPGHDGVAMGRIRGFFDTAQHPSKMANLLLAASLFRRGDLATLRNEVFMALTPDRELDLLLNASAWSVFHSGQLGVPASWAFNTRLAVSVGTNAAGLALPPAAPPATASPPAVQWRQFGAGQGYVTVDTPRTKAAVGYIQGRPIQLTGLELTATPELLPWASVGLTLIRGDAFTNGTFLVIASGWIENTGMKWKDANKDSVGNQWGAAPTLIESVPFTVTLPVAADRVRAWALDERGQRKGSLTVREAGGGRAEIVGSAAAATLWHEVEVAPPATASFDQWRQRQFTPAELADPAVSGPEASPAGDGLTNFQKYALALDPHQPAPREAIPHWSVVDGGDESCLQVKFQRTKGMSDARVRPLFSNDLVSWIPSPAEADPLTVVDAGPIEHVTLNHCPPADGRRADFGRIAVERLGP